MLLRSLHIFISPAAFDHAAAASASAAILPLRNLDAAAVAAAVAAAAAPAGSCLFVCVYCLGGLPSL